MNKSIIFKDVKEIQEDLRKLKALQQEPCEDCISRQAVIDEIEFFQINPQHFDFVSLIDNIKDLPSVNPQKIGHWIDTGSGQECSECREIQYGYDSFRYFCANCGAKMVEPQESEE